MITSVAIFLQPSLTSTENLRYLRQFVLAIVLCFVFHGLHFSTSLMMLKPVLCFHMTSLNYGSKGVRDVNATCICHKSNIMPDSILIINIAQCVTCD